MPAVGLIGFERSGKTTLFNALTGAGRPTGFAAHAEAHEGVMPAADQRLARLAALYRPRKTTAAALMLVDFPGAGFAGALGGGGAPGPRLLDQLSRLDALVHVVRAFENDAVPHPAERIDPAADLEAMQLELTFADLALIEKRLERIGAETKALKAAERVAVDRERETLARLQSHLSEGGTLRDAPLGADERAGLRQYRFLTERPLLTLWNTGEDGAESGAAPGGGLALRVRVEEELRAFEAEEAAAYREELALGPSAVELVRREVFQLLGLRTFFTVGADECRAWTVPGGCSAQRAAGRIHSDLERGFIRAEVVHWDDLLECGSEAEAKRRALLHTEGKDYEVQDGDVIHVLFNV